MASGPPDPTVPLAALPALSRRTGGVGAPIARRFGLGAPLGSGGMGIVSEATDRECARTVAVKQLPDETRPADGAGSPGRGARHDALLIEEARIQGRLDHPAIPPVFELGHDEAGRPAFAMRIVTGVTLARVLAEAELRAGFPLDRLLRGFVDVCLAIEHAHQRGVLHCDLKPGNIMFDAEQRVHVLDWGVATRFGAGATDEELPARRAGGTPGYMAPEQRDGSRALDARVDVHALGCVLFELLAGEPLYPRGVVDPEVNPRPSRRPGGSDTAASLDDACVRATARDPEERIASAAELAAIVTDWLDRTQDPAIRAELARAHLERAHAAINVDRMAALGDASRALALAPDDAAAVALVAALLDGDDVPAGARAEIDAHEQRDERKLARAAAISYTGFLLFPLTLLAQGTADVRVIIAVLAGWAALVALALAAARGLGPRGWLWWSVVGLALEATLFARYLGPFVVTPGLAALTAAGAMMHPRVRHRAAVTAALCLPLLAPFALELTGLVSSTMRFDGGTLHLRSTISALEPVPTIAGLLGTAVAMLMVAAVIGRLVAAPAHQARRRLAAQAWHLARMLPAARVMSLDSISEPRRGRP